MNFSVHMDPDTMALLDRLVKTEKRSRSAVIKEAVRELAQLKQPAKRWPREIASFLASPKPMKDPFPGFEAYRANLLPLDPERFGALDVPARRRK